MALVTKGWELSISLVDNGGNVSTLSWEANTAVVTDYTTAAAQRQNLITDLLAVTNSVIKGTRLSEVQYEDALVFPAQNIENENKASITYLIAGTNEYGNLKIPAPKIGLFVASSGSSANIVNVSSNLVTDYAANFEVTGGWFVSDGQSLDSVLKGKRVSAKNNNG